MGSCGRLEVSLLKKERDLIKSNYFCVHTIVSGLLEKTENDTHEVGAFLGNIDIANELVLYRQDNFCKLYDIDTNVEQSPLNKIISLLMSCYPFDTDELIDKTVTEVRCLSYGLYWLKSDIYNFKPIMDLGIIDVPPTQAVKAPSINKNINSYKLMFFKQSLFTVDECACIISGSDPLEIERFPQNEIEQIAPDYCMARRFIQAAIEANHLNCFNYKVGINDLKDYLISNNIIINGFNDELEANNNANTPKNTDIESQIKIDTLQAELALAQERIKLLEAKQEQVEQNNLLDLIYDDTAQERYSPDLVTAIKLWEHLYINNSQSTDSHSNKADTWLKNHTGYDVAKKAGSASKIREITAPFANWSTLRDKNYKK